MNLAGTPQMTVKITEQTEKFRKGGIKDVFCKNCGSKLEDGARFCSGCGCSVSDIDAPISSKTAQDRRKTWIVIAMGIAVILCSCIFAFTRMREEETGGCDSYTLGETSGVSQWILENWGVDDIEKCYFIELISTYGEPELIVKRPGSNVDYALFSIDNDEILGKYEFDKWVSGIYAGTNNEGIDIYLMESFNIGSRQLYYAINEMGKIEHVLEGSTLYDVSYGENGKQENLKCGIMSMEEGKKFRKWLNGEPVQFSFLMEEVEADFEYKYAPVTNRIEEIHMDLYEEEMEGECSFHYLNLGDGSFLDSVTLYNQSKDGENEYTAQINYNRDAQGNVTSVEIDESEGSGGS